ncbi:subclass B3 metallo-beta-lactamase [Niabella insulamsoli]|uniref:subclass B3 metallo-beta-lactamase n=1 Tax=Niabella insulamsoli TaxID=3144874 RepID=UPI0031FF8DE0
MKKYIVICFLLCCSLLNAQQVKEPGNNPEEWSKPYEPFRIVGNLYYVGTYDLASYLVVTNKGSMLINTGLAGSLPRIKSNIEKLGFKYEDVKILLTNQAHYDHVGALAEIKRQTGARFYANAADASVLKDGGKSDYELSHLGQAFRPVEPDKLLKDRDTIQLGTTQLTMLHHPGHTKGSCSYLLDVTEAGKTYKVLIANIPTIITDRPFAQIAEYPSIKKDYTYTFEAMKKLKFDIWLAAHASQFDLHEKRSPNTPYNPGLFVDPKGYQQALQNAEDRFIKHP